MTVRAAALRALGLAVAAGSFGFAVGCGDSYSAVIDSLPIALTRAPMGGGMGGNGALVALAAEPEASTTSFPMLISTGTSMTLLQGPPPIGTPATEKVGFDLLDPTTALLDPTNPAVRGMFRGVSMLRLPLQAIGDGSVAPGGILGGDILRRYSVDLRFGAACGTGGMEICSTMTFWGHLGADLGFLEDAGYAVIRFSLYGGGETTAEGDPDFLGQRGPLVLPPTRIVFRSCAVPDEFSPDLPLRNQVLQGGRRRPAGDGRRSDADARHRRRPAGARPVGLGTREGQADDGTRRGPERRAPGRGLGGARSSPPGRPCRSSRWSTMETGAATDPGPCVELRARAAHRAGLVPHRHGPDGGCLHAPVRQRSARTRQGPEQRGLHRAVRSRSRWRSSPTNEPYLQGLRFDVRPEGPELDGVLGAGALGRSRVEIDYTVGARRAPCSRASRRPRATECCAAARCPRLPDRELPAPLLRTEEPRPRPDLCAVGMLTRTRTRTRTRTSKRT